MSSSSKCPGCGAASIFQHRYVDAGSGRGPQLLPDLGGVGSYGTFTVFVCTDCGLTRFYAEPLTRAQVQQSPDWTRVS
ncbi:MAG: hypothetical protein O2894_05440 [Planctomycetota bacterium]|nr:hypothetical protein [Planctomycetota bacterium]